MTETETSTETPPTATETAAYLSYKISTYNANYTVTLGDVYYEFADTDFVGSTAYTGRCDNADGNGVVSTPSNDYQCNTYEDCMNICSWENQRDSYYTDGDGYTHEKYCVGISYTYLTDAGELRTATSSTRRRTTGWTIVGLVKFDGVILPRWK